MVTAEVTITGPRFVRVWFARNLHFKRDVSAMATAYVFMCGHRIFQVHFAFLQIPNCKPSVSARAA